MRGGGLTTCSLSLSNAALVSGIHFSSFLPSLSRSSYNGFARSAIQGIQRCTYENAPRVLRSIVTVVGNGVLNSSSLLALLIENISSPITSPKNSICLTPKVHFLGLRSIPTSRILNWRTFRNRWRCSAHVVPYTMSSR